METTLPEWATLDADVWVESDRNRGTKFTAAKIVKVNKVSVVVAWGRVTETFRIGHTGALKANTTQWGGDTLRPADYAPAHAYLAEQARRNRAYAAETALHAWRTTRSSETADAAVKALAVVLAADLPGGRDAISAARLREIADTIPADHRDRPGLLRAAEILDMLDDLAG